jgi:hypothetical protein
MRTSELKRLLIILVIVLLVINLVAFAAKLISGLLFWAIIIVFAVIAWRWAKKD